MRVGFSDQNLVSIKRLVKINTYTACVCASMVRKLDASLVYDNNHVWLCTRKGIT